MIVQRGVDELELVSARSELNGFRLSTRIMPALDATRGGDWCEAFAISERIVALSIGDVCGHGPEVYETMLTTREVVREAALRRLGPGQVLALANRALCRKRPDVYVSAIFGLLDTHRHTLTFANAGHPPPLTASSLGEHFIELGTGNLLLGVDAAAVPTVHVVDVPAGTLVVFYTDGVIDRRRDATLGPKALLSAAAFAHHYSALSAASVIERQMFLTGPNNDDAAILTARAPSMRLDGAR